MTVAVEPPDLPTRLVVLRRLAEEAGVETADALAELARRIDANVRRLHGALTKVVAHASLTATPLSPELIAELIPIRPRAHRADARRRDPAARRRAPSASPAPSSSAPAAPRPPLRARQVAILLTRELTDLSLPQIGRLYGGRDHSTVLNSVRRAEASLADDAELAERVAELRAAIHSPPSDQA